MDFPSGYGNTGSAPNGDSLRAEASKTGTVPGPIGGCPRLLRVEATAVAKSLTPMNGISALQKKFFLKSKKFFCKALKLRLLRRLALWLCQTRKPGTAPDEAGDSPRFTPCGCKKRLNYRHSGVSLLLAARIVHFIEVPKLIYFT
jgi:hypothetical protein